MDLSKIKNIKLLSDSDVVYPDNLKEKKIKVKLTPTSAILLYEKDEDGNFIEDGGLVEKIHYSGYYYRGVLDSVAKNGKKIVRGVARELNNGSDKELILNVRETISNTESVLLFGDDGDSVALQQRFDDEFRFFLLCRDPKGNLIAATDNKGIVLQHEGKERHFLYTFADEFVGDKKDNIYGDIIMYESDFNFINDTLYPNSGTWLCRVNQKMPYYAYTINNQKAIYNVEKGEYEIIDEGPEVKKLIDKVRAEAHKQLKEWGIDNYDRKSRTYIKETTR